VVELRNERKTSWPTGPADRDDARRPNNRRIMGAKYYLADITGRDSKLAATGVVPLDQNRVNAHWYLWEGERPAVHSYAKKSGYIAVKYKDELFELTNHKAHFRWFGVADAKVQSNLFFILEAQLFDPQVGMWGVHPDQSRNRLNFTGNGDKGAPIPMVDWGNEFSELMPEEIREAILKARGEGSNTLTDDEYRKRLQDKFGSRWITTQLVQSSSTDDKDAAEAMPTNEDAQVIERRPPSPNPQPKNRQKRKRRIHIIRLRATPGGNGQGVEREVAVDVPRFDYVGKDAFESPWHLASWVPADPQGPTVLMNRDCPILLEAIKYHQDQYPDVYAQEVEKIVRDTYGEVAVCKIAHSQKLAKHVAEDLDETYRSEEALTVGLMGLLAEESLIAQRLGKLVHRFDEIDHMSGIHFC
jgi:hypothetical protein